MGTLVHSLTLGGEQLLSHILPLNEPLLDHNRCRWEPLFDYRSLVWELLSDRVIFVRDLLLSRVVLLAAKRGDIVTRTEQALQRGPSLTLCTACVVDVRSTTAALGQSLGDTKRWATTSLTSNLFRRVTDLANQSI